MKRFIAALALLGFGAPAFSQVTLLNVSYDPTRGFYQEYNAAFARYWEARSGEKVAIRQSHGGSAKQARSIVDGLQADVATLALAYDIDMLADQASLVLADWQKRLPHNSSPYTSTVIFLVRKGNPKGIRDWSDLVKPGVSVITPNPKTSGSARWNYLAAWGAAIKRGQTADQAKELVSRIYKNVPVLDSGARGATTTFVERGIGDVLVNWENEILLGANELGRDRFEIVVPPTSILTEPTVALVDKVVDKRGTRRLAQAYLDYLYSPEGQEIAAKHYFRPIDPEALGKRETQLPKAKLFTLAEIACDWRKTQKTHFDDGGVFDRIYLKK